MFFGVMLQSELAAESLESDPDYRAGAEILANTLEESGLEDQTFVRAVGEVRDTLLHTPAPPPPPRRRRRRRRRRSMLLTLAGVCCAWYLE